MSYGINNGRGWLLATLLAFGLVLMLGAGLGCPKQGASGQVRRGGPAWLSVKTAPWSELYVDGAHVGRTPVRKYQIAPGEHTLTVRCGPCKSKQEVTVEFVVEPGGTYVNNDISFDVNKTSIK